MSEREIGAEQIGVEEIGVGIIGAGWLGDVHARAWGRLRHHYPDLGVRPRMVAVADSVAAATAAASDRHGYARTYSDWRDLLADPEVDVVSVTAPNAVHREIGVAVAAAGKHLWIEKPVGLSAADAEAVADAVAAAGVQAAVGFNYRTFPALQALREHLRSGAIGTPTHARVRLLSDYAAHPLGLHTWRYSIASGGHGVLGDLASHAVDLTRYVLGELDRLVAETAVFIGDRPLPVEGAAAYGHGLGAPDAERAAVENEDYVSALVRTVDGVLVTLECSRVATGEQNTYGIEIHGSTGLLAWDFRRSGELVVSTGETYGDQPTRTQHIGPGWGEHARFQPGSALPLSFDDSKVIELARLLRAITGGPQEQATLADGVASARALEAMVASAATQSWVQLDGLGKEPSPSGRNRSFPKVSFSSRGRKGETEVGR